MTLKDIKIGDKAQIVRIHGSGPVRRRILDMGVTRGEEIQVKKVAPLGDPIEFKIRNYDLSLRKSEAELVEVRAVIC